MALRAHFKSVAEEESKKMRIKSAAIKYRLRSKPDIDKVTWGYNHTYCYNWFRCADIHPNERIPEFEEEGFLTDSGEFVDREYAYQIAQQAGQLRYERPDKKLISENVIY